MEFSDNGNSSKEIREFKINDFLAQKRRQQLRANNHELRQLERHIQSAVVNKQLNEQLRNAKQLKQSELCEKRKENANFAAECELIRKSALKQEEQEMRDKKMLLETLNSQINEIHQKRLKEIEDAYKDRQQMGKIMKQVEAEEDVKRKEAELFREKCRKEMEETYNNIKLKQRFEEKRKLDENERNLTYQLKCDRIKAEKEVERNRILEEKEGLTKLLSDQLTLINLEKEKRGHLLLSLSMQEHRAREEKDFKEALVKLANDKQKLSFEIDNYCYEMKTRKEIQFKEEEEEFRIQNLRYLEERDKLWQLSEEKRRRKIKDHNKELSEMIERRRYEKANKIAEQILEYEKTKTDHNKSDLLVEQERVLMLNSVPKDLIHYLPPGVLKSSDKELLKF